ncbi:MAG: hypothetical protein K6B14_00400 [Lachnospiraceae bacterium]|nr:hypothetical protein [Lachnospiraceae bacterium]
MLDIKRFLIEEDGVGVVEVILILVVLISLVLIFKDRITKVAGDILDKVEKDAGRV